MIILGLGGLLSDAACAVLKGGEISAAIEEGKIARNVISGAIPQAAIAECLRLSGVKREQVDCVAIARPFSRGPESILQTKTLAVDSGTKALDFKVQRWIDPSKRGWWSGDHHIHAAGCAHYTKPTEGVHAKDMIRHVLGED